MSVFNKDANDVVFNGLCICDSFKIEDVGKNYIKINPIGKRVNVFTESIFNQLVELIPGKSITSDWSIEIELNNSKVFDFNHSNGFDNNEVILSTKQHDIQLVNLNTRGQLLILQNDFTNYRDKHILFDGCNLLSNTLVLLSNKYKIENHCSIISPKNIILLNEEPEEQKKKLSKCLPKKTLNEILEVLDLQFVKPEFLQTICINIGNTWDDKEYLCIYKKDSWIENYIPKKIILGNGWCISMDFFNAEILKTIHYNCHNIYHAYNK